MTDRVLHDSGERDNMTDACIAILNIVRTAKREIGAEKIVFKIRISSDDITVEVEPWEPYESDIKAVVDLLADKMIGRR